MAFNQLRLYSDFSLYGKVHKVVSINPPNVWIKRVDGEDREMLFIDLVTHPTFIAGKSMKTRKKEVVVYDALAKLSETRRDEVSDRFEVIHPLILLDEIKSGNLRSVQKFIDKYGTLLYEGEDIEKLTQDEIISRNNKIREIQKRKKRNRSTILGWLKLYRDQENEVMNSGVEGLILSRGRGYTGRTDTKTMEICDPNRPDIVLDVISVRQDDAVIAIVKRIIENEYLTKYRVSKAVVHRSINDACIIQQLPCLSYSTVSEILNRVDEKAKELYRNRKNATAIYEDVARGYADRDALHPLDIIQIDHTRLDMQVIDDITGLTIDRPWITIGIDVYSRLPWCLYVSFEPPSINVVRKAIQHGVFFKHAKKRFGTESEWAAFGIPNVIYVDNGMDFKSGEIKRLVNETLKAEIMHRPVRTPRYGAIIERLFRTINDQLIHNILGTTKSKFADLGDINPEEEACLSLSQIRKILMVYLTDMYPIKDHRGLPLHSKTPLNRYNDGCVEAGYPEWIESSEEERYRLEFMLTLKKPYTREGVRLDNRIYKSDECSDIIGKKTQKYIIKYDLDDISKIYIYHPKKERFIELFCYSPAYEQVEGVNAYTFKQVRQKWIEEGEIKKKSIPGNDQYARASQRVQEEILTGLHKKKRLRKALARMSESSQQNIAEAFLTSQTQILNENKTKYSREEELFLAAALAEEEEGWGSDA
ncbi:Mu transposase C-terminal domain-containing protein [Paenibacillus glycanilyticus]|uniref:Integrase catalytic domain-containing protein n=1 Tax=Paenibacillus glycanilyticus TaxID=126569 RepID=A0ABQ6GKL7_9BACL|nr:Mu transposase C-terminal domain-containing protein [Paenibacillus glycanilyticus]GLX71429.1 hypothetical protein MU1_57790 [Paenibacillus glycanilyticus]